MILVDSSVWIDFFDYPHAAHARLLKELLEENEELCLADVNVTEILQGIRHDADFDRIKELLAQFPVFKAGGLETFIRAADIYRACRKKGKTISRTVDAIIAAIAIEHKLQIFHNDRDFDRIAECSALKIWRPGLR